VRTVDNLIIGSGPGGSVTAYTLTKAGRDTCLVEEGDWWDIRLTMPFSTQELQEKYRNGGMTTAFGAPTIAYAEARCAGGGSEINSGLYHRTPAEILDTWADLYRLQQGGTGDLSEYFDACEKQLGVSYARGVVPRASLKLAEGAEALGWKAIEVPRWFKEMPGHPHLGIRQSMTETFLKDARAGGCLVLTNWRATRIRKAGSQWEVFGASGNGNRDLSPILANNLFVCAGAIQTPALLRRSGIRANIGNTLQMHPTVKVLARFDEKVNQQNMGVPVHQVKEHSPVYSFGCAISSPPFLGIALAEFSEELERLESNWEYMAIYYCMITPSSSGTIRALPYFLDPVVRYQLSESDLALLSRGLRDLCRCLLGAGAKELFPSVSGLGPFRSVDDLSNIPPCLPRRGSNIMTIHAFSSCPMGENQAVCATNSFGKVNGHENLFINDGSILCTAPGVNPQGTIMAFARRNAEHFLESST